MRLGRFWASSPLVALALAGCGSGHHQPAAASLTGTYLVQATFNTGKPTPACDTVGAAKTGDQVTVTDTDGHPLATGTLGQPESSTRPADQRNLTTQLSCRFSFTTGPVADRPSYQVQIGGSPPTTYRRADLIDHRWNITVELERNITGQP